MLALLTWARFGNHSSPQQGAHPKCKEIMQGLLTMHGQQPLQYMQQHLMWLQWMHRLAQGRRHLQQLSGQ